jgi:hypothetical protein
VNPDLPKKAEDFQAIFDAFKSGGFLTGFVGAGGMIARLLLRPEEGMTIWKALRHTLAAFITGVSVWYAIRDMEISGQAKAGCYAISGMASPEILDGVLRWIQAKANAKVAEVKKGSNGKRSRKKR